MKLRERMKLFRVAAAWPDITLDEFAEQMKSAAEGGETRSGIRVSAQGAMNLSAVYNAVNLISGSIASCSFILYRRLDEQSRERLRGHPLYAILHHRVGPNMTSHQWVRTSVAHLLFWGNAYSIILRDGYRGAILGLKILHPNQVKIYQVKDTSDLLYEVKLLSGKEVTLTRADILHIPGLGFNGVTGFSVLSLARESFGLTTAAEVFGQNFFGSGVNAGGFLERPLEAPKLATKEARERLLESIREGYSGMGNQGKWILLEEGTKFNKNIIPLEDAQFLLTRTFQIDEVARWFNIPPHKLKELTRATFSNIEHQQIEYIQDTIQPWCTLIETEVNAQLIEPDRQDELFAEFLLDSLLRGDSVARNNALAIQRQWGIINADEWRQKENMNPQPDGQGQKYLVPTNYTVADKIGEPVPATAPQPSTDSVPAANVLLRVGAAEKRAEGVLIGLQNLASRMDAILAVEKDKKPTRKKIIMHHLDGSETIAEIMEE
jgi:HK97 family phage portal protein